MWPEHSSSLCHNHNGTAGKMSKGNEDKRNKNIKANNNFISGI